MDKAPKAFLRSPAAKLPGFNDPNGVFDEQSSCPQCRLTWDSVQLSSLQNAATSLSDTAPTFPAITMLRDHLGDECLGHAGGVLYEMIEVDCQHSDDPGAAFQRWRHDHMNRHADLELPHVPHLTTVTSAITPTANLIRWRKDHSQRYETRLSDHSPTSQQSFLQTSGIWTRKEWMIEYTMYVSSRVGGTRPFRRINAKAFHELQWDSSLKQTGRLVGEKSLDLNDLSWNSESEKIAEETHLVEQSPQFGPRGSRCRSEISGFLRSFCSPKKPATSPIKMSCLAGRQGFIMTASLRDVLESRPSPRVNEWEIPNANFARKFGLYTDSGPLPTSIKELPVAEDKAMDMAAGPGLRELVYSWRFQGPFTPQLWFDSGVDPRRTRI
ncbi:hypothetical protein AK830_g12015 [Neonectria ditissima]|uniref:Uncharacterized protein n=1 Tax=Neonectria ditissima TaxID=78410 RepID=A0A0P7B440_9HYPO|nr:hypothetical protein AK830_g12015 [Neonectria ditissima]